MLSTFSILNLSLMHATKLFFTQAKLLGDPPVSSLQTPDFARVSFVEDATSEEVGPSSPGKTSKHPVEDHSL